MCLQSCGDLPLEVPVEAAVEKEGVLNDRAQVDQQDKERREDGQAAPTTLLPYARRIYDVVK